MSLPLATDFSHTSPYGVVTGKDNYLKIANDNKDMFLGNTFEIHDELYTTNKACIRYTMYSKNASLEVTEWFYFENNLIKEIVAYYHLENERKAGRSVTY